MTLVNSRDSLKNYCLQELGHPVLEINVDDDQVDDRIDEAIQYYQQFHEDGVQRTYLSHLITDDDKTNKYISVANNVIGVIKVFPSSASTSAINMWDIRYQWRLQDITSFTTGSISHYWITRTHLRMMEMELVGEKPIRFNKLTNKLYVDWDWQSDVNTGQYVLIEATVVVDPEAYTKMYNDFILKRYATQLIKRQWGQNMSKHSGIKMLDGVTLNGLQLFQMADTEVKSLEKEIRSTYEQPPMFIVG